MSEPNGSKIIVKEKRAGVLLPLVFKEPFDYRVPEGMELQKGDYVRVPFGRQSVWGIVWGEAKGEVPEAKLKAIECMAGHLPPMSETMRAFLTWTSWYTLAPLGMVLKMALPSPEALEPPKEEALYRLSQANSSIKMTPARLRIHSYLSDGTARSAKHVALHAKVTPAVLREYIKAGGPHGGKPYTNRCLHRLKLNIYLRRVISFRQIRFWPPQI